MVDSLREALVQRPDKQCAVMLDTVGPEIRIGVFKDNKAVDIPAGQQIRVVTD